MLETTVVCLLDTIQATINTNSMAKSLPFSPPVHAFFFIAHAHGSAFPLSIL